MIEEGGLQRAVDSIHSEDGLQENTEDDVQWLDRMESDGILELKEALVKLDDPQTTLLLHSNIWNSK